jgi:AraC-like DNA-binding protein
MTGRLALLLVRLENLKFRMRLPEVTSECGMDVLSDVLRAVRLTGAIFFSVEANAPWVAATPPAVKIAGSVMPEAEHVIMFHAVTHGACWFELEETNESALRLVAGDIVVLPKGQAHVFCSAPGMRARPNLGLYNRPTDQPLPFMIGLDKADGESTHFVCGYLGCDARPFNPILSGLPPVLHAHAAEGTGYLNQLIALATEETSARRAGGEIVLAKLAELMFVEIVRRYIDMLPAHASTWLAGLRDPHVSKALHVIHARPAEQWTLERLAQEAGLSRSVFAGRFAHFVHDTPLQYLTRWRMQLATRLLEGPGIGLAQVASDVGYESEAAFNRAFKKCVGVPPGAWRKGHFAHRGNSAEIA